MVASPSGSMALRTRDWQSLGQLANSSSTHSTTLSGSPFPVRDRLPTVGMPFGSAKTIKSSPCSPFLSAPYPVISSGDAFEKLDFHTSTAVPKSFSSAGAMTPLADDVLPHPPEPSRIRNALVAYTILAKVPSSLYFVDTISVFMVVLFYLLVFGLSPPRKGVG